MALTLVSRSWQDKNGYLSPISSVPLTGAFGEERVLTLNYSFSQQLDGCEIFFNPALFVEQGILLEQSQSLPPNVAYWYKVTASTTTAVEHTMNLLNSNATERNISVTFELNPDRLSFTIRLTCFLTADILQFLNDNGIDNSIRLLGNTKDADEVENLEDSVYSTDSKGIGIHTGVKVPSVSQLCGTKGQAGGDGVQEDTYTADGELFAVRFNAQVVIDKLEIFVNGVLTASSGTNAGNNFGGVDGFDGNAGAGYALGAHPNPPVVPSPNYWYIGGNTTFDNRLSDFQSDTGFTATLNGYQQVVWVNTQIGDTIVVRVAGTDNTNWYYEIFCPQQTTTIPGRYDYDDGWISSEFVFLNECTMTNPVFELSRNGDVVNDFASFVDTDVTLRIDHTSAITQAKVWVIDADNTKQSLDFKKAYGYDTNNYFDVAVPSNVSGNTYETSFVINKDKLNLSGRYFIIAVYYDSANDYVASYISDAIFVTDVQFLTPTITGTIYNLVADLQSNYVEVSPLQRICCQITLDKYTGFDAAYLGGVLNVNGQKVPWFGKDNQGDFKFSDSSGSLIIRYYLRVEEDWQGTEIDILWKINFNVEYTTITFPQRIAVTQMEQNKATPNLLEIKLYKDGVTLLEEGDSACDANFVRLETIKDASAADYAQTAIWKDENGNIYEEEAWSPISVFTQASNAFQSDVEVYFSDADGADDVSHKVTNEVTTGEVGMIGYPPPIPLNFIRHPFQNTIFTGRNTVFEAKYDSSTGKSIATVNDIPSYDFLFRVGTDSTPLNANDNAWAAFTDLDFATFAVTPVTAGQRIMVRYIGEQEEGEEQYNISGYIEMPIAETPVNPVIIQIPIEKDIAAGDMMLFTGLNMNFTFLTYQTGSANDFSNKRTFAEIAANSDLVTYNSGLGSANSPNNSFVPHLYFNRTSTTAITPNLTIDQTENPNVEIGMPALPLYNKYYPVTNLDDNPQALLYDRLNDVGQLLSPAASSYFDFSSAPNNTFFEFCFVYRESPRLTPAGIRLFTNTNSLGNSVFEIIVAEGDKRPSVIEGPTNNSFRHLLSAGSTLVNNSVYRIYIRLKKSSSTGNTSTRFNLAESFAVVNGHKTSFAVLNEGTALASDTSDTCFVGGANTVVASALDAPQAYHIFAGNAQAVTPVLSLEDVEQFILGDYSVLTQLEAYYPLNSVSANVVANQGVNSTVGDFTQVNGANQLQNLFI